MKKQSSNAADTPETEPGEQVAIVMESDLGEPLKKNDEVLCPNCGELHPIVLAKNADGVETDALIFVSCGGESFCVGIGGRRWK